MKAVFLSDIHVDINREYPVAKEFAGYIKEQGARLAVIAGDVSETQQETLDTLNRIEQDSGARVLFVPGNHDLWGPEGDPDQIAAIYDRYVQDEHCLCGRDVVLGDRVFIGSNRGGVSREHPLELTAMDRAYIAGYDIVHTSIFSYIEDELPLLRQASFFGQGGRGIFETMCAIC